MKLGNLNEVEALIRWKELHPEWKFDTWLEDKKGEIALEKIVRYDLADELSRLIALENRLSEAGLDGLCLNSKSYKRVVDRCLQYNSKQCLESVLTHHFRSSVSHLDFDSLLKDAILLSDCGNVCTKFVLEQGVKITKVQEILESVCTTSQNFSDQDFFSFLVAETN